MHGGNGLKNYNNKANTDVLRSISLYLLGLCPVLSPVHSSRHDQWSPDTAWCCNITVSEQDIRRR